MSAATDSLRIEYMPLSALLKAPRNPKGHDIPLLHESFGRFGYVEPVALNERTGRLVAGHGRLQALQEAKAKGTQPPKRILVKNGEWLVPVLRGIDFENDQEAEAYLITSNQATIAGGYDEKILAEVLADHVDTPLGLAGMGFDNDDVANLLLKVNGDASAGGEPSEPPVDAAAELQKKWDTALGQLWKIGDQMLLCGDSTRPESFARFPRSVNLFWTSPPYSDQREYKIGKFDWNTLVTGVTQAMLSRAAESFHAIVNLGPSHKDGRFEFYWNDWLKFCEETLGLPLYSFYVWDKGCGMPGDWAGRLRPRHEFLFHFARKPSAARKWVETESTEDRGGHTFRQPDGRLQAATSPDKFGSTHRVPDSVVNVTRETGHTTATESHPAAFSVGLCSFVLKTWSDERMVVLDPFCGSGTTLVACQRLNRIGYGCELAPEYVAVTLERLSLLGLKPELISKV